MQVQKTWISARCFRLQFELDIRLAVEFQVWTAELTTYLCGLGSMAVWIPCASVYGPTWKGNWSFLFQEELGVAQCLG